MRIKLGSGTTEYGPGVEITLTGDEVARAIDAWLVAKGVAVRGPRTIKVNGELCEHGRVYVDPSGFVIDKHGEHFGAPLARSIARQATLEEKEAALKAFAESQNLAKS